MPRLRTAKSAASRIDVLYFKRRPPLRKIRIVLTALCILGAIAWWAVPQIRASKAKGDHRRENVAVNALFNPGHLTQSHALFQNDCTVCHEGVKEGSFFAKDGFFAGKVTDQKCLQCHDVAIHATAQKAFVKSRDPKDPGYPKSNIDGSPVAANDPRLLVSSDCIRCHVEHRGKEALAGTTDSHCTQCHGNLPAHTKDGMARGIEPKVTAFSKESHPAFGKHPSTQPGTLLAWEAPKMEDGKTGQPVLVDKTVLRFNHSKHATMELLQTAADAAGNKSMDCAKCHSTREPDPKSVRLVFLKENEPAGKDLNTIYLKPGEKIADRGVGPPWTTDKDRPAGWDTSSNREYMRPVSYERHCVACHRMEIPGSGVDIPHAELAVVRAVLTGLRPEQQEFLIGKPPKPAATTAGTAAPSEGSAPTPPPSTGGVPRLPRPRYMGPDKAPLQQILFAPPRPGQSPSASSSAGGSSATAVVKTANEVALDKLDRAFKAMPASVPADVKAQARATLNALKESFKPTTPPATQPSGMAAPWQADPSLLEAYAVFLGSNQCVYCHDVKGDVPRLASPPRTAAAAAPAGESSGPPRAGRPPRPGSSSSAEVKPAEPMKPLLATVPTGVSAAPRRWYEHSKFDHDGHRNMTCVSCHDWAELSSDTKDFLSPNLTWTTRKRDAKGVPVAGDWTALSARSDPKLVESHSCLECHHAPTRSSPGAGNNCQMCHSFHNRSIEGRAHGVGSISEFTRMSHPLGAEEDEAPSTQPATPGGAEPAATQPAAP